MAHNESSDVATEFRLDGKSLLITPAKKPRAGWFDGYRPDDSDAFAALCGKTQRSLRSKQNGALH